MRYRAILPLAVMTLGLGVAGCGGGGGIGDLVDKATDLIPNTKKPLPGERKSVFPEGVPGVPQGVPPELVKGYQAAPETAAPPQSGGTQAGAPAGESEPAKAEPEKPKPKPKKTAAKPPAQPPAQPSRNQANQGAWPGVPSAQSAPAPAPSQPQPAGAWPAPQSQPTAAWPDPRQPAPQQPAQYPRRPHAPMSFRLAIIGRPNVGKSTLFNRLVGRRLALVDDLPGVTRDRHEGEGRLGDLAFTAVDTAGLEEAGPASLSGRMLAQTKLAIEQADAILFLIDARVGLTPGDRAFADLVRRCEKPAILIANKSEGAGGAAGALEAYALGLGEPVAISAEQGEGLADLYDALREALPDRTPPISESGEGAPDERISPSRPIHVAVVGRPNSGKSTLINRLLGEERLLT